MKLKDRVAVVTGASAGIGKAIAIALASEGADIAGAARGVERLQETKKAVEALGRKFLLVKCDVTKREDCQNLIDQALKRFGKIDILVNNAGGGARGQYAYFYEMSEELWDHIIALNLKSVFYCCRAVIGHMMERRYGKIINVASIFGMVGAAARMVDYSAAKAGVIGFTMALAKEVGPYGINVNCASPNLTATEVLNTVSKEFQEEVKKRSYLGRLCQPEDMAKMVLFLASDDASYITGQNFPVMGATNLG